MSEILLNIKKLNKTYQNRKKAGIIKVLNNIDLSMKAGEFVSLRGPSGCGKSTLLLSAGGLLKPDSGQILINGEDPYQMNSSLRARFRGSHIGFVFQRFHLIPYLTVLDNVIVPELTLGKSYRQKAVEILEKFGLSRRLNHYPSELSVGEQQRVALARAVCPGVSLILADEPTGNLDNENGKIVLGFMRDFVDNGGAVLIVTHEQFADEYATRQMEMKEGQLIE